MIDLSVQARSVHDPTQSTHQPQTKVIDDGSQWLGDGGGGPNSAALPIHQSTPTTQPPKRQR